ncbi:DUF2750 domain-containing protein [Pseudoalteromonas luteoviolacea]|uniref:DUF2750 domain-containing protein n=1 Tax=Pseudoalteromonas luteoviolacea DSM 6061 TaxID=1365250 RepID=A0A161XUR2_9GAMM|nr:DUF2750 domain-containing protein [Pseudoalteromonas luteoviolacea]KZN35126.1 hypothetical protein N475_03240 [Pseudoalteromonas luteoviolacea DSM 6061]KZN52877.1 hypothetical protein N474_02880 [Pseudoalteromonas luteoviolacea CPMOR-2]MBE0384869.1 hypothetical protein [Pseudoalteromonas luteoviolacea DSM 6061]TQF66618.1 DUF2750 domain-containing protein [Pseudoalteromonas luteoviolacea]
MNDLELESEVVNFVTVVKQSEQVWALGAEDGGFVIVESNQFEESDVLLLWADESAALEQCKDEWEEFKPIAIDLDSLLDEWVEDLRDDNALIGINWNNDNVCVEIEPVSLARALAD